MSVYEQSKRNVLYFVAQILSIGSVLFFFHLFGWKILLFGNGMISGYFGLVVGSISILFIMHLMNILDDRLFGKKELKQSFNDYVNDLEPLEISELAEAALENYKVRAAIEDHLEFESAEQKHKFSKIKNT